MRARFARACVYFYPRPPRGGRPVLANIGEQAILFLSTPSARRATLQIRQGVKPGNYFYPRPPRGGRPGYFSGKGYIRQISIHALREEGDACQAAKARPVGYFYPRPPRGGRPQLFVRADSVVLFLSTPSARRATAKTETKSLFSYKLYNILHEFRRALIYNGSKNDPNHAKRHKNPVRRCRKNAENSPFAPGRETQNNSRPSCSKGG